MTEAEIYKTLHDNHLATNADKVWKDRAKLEPYKNIERLVSWQLKNNEFTKKNPWSGSFRDFYKLEKWMDNHAQR